MKVLLTLSLWLCIGLEWAGAQMGPDTVWIGSLQEAVAKAIRNNPNQAVYEEQIRQARYNYRATRGALLPSASVGANGQDNLELATTPIPGQLVGAPGTTYDAQFGKHYSYNAGLTVSQNIFNWQAVLQAKVADNMVSLTRCQQESYIQSLKEQVARSYFSILVARESLRIISSDQGIGDSLVSLAQQRLSEGTGDALSVNQAVISENNVLQNRALTQQLYDQGVENLKILTGSSFRVELCLSAAVGLDSVAGGIEDLVQLGPDKSMDPYRQQVRVAALQRKSQLSAAYPTLSATGYFGMQQFRDDPGLSFDNKAWTGNQYLGLSLSVPLFTGLTNTNKYKSAVMQEHIAQSQYEAASQQSEINDHLLLKNNNDYLQLVKASEGNFHLYAANFLLNGQKYSEGVITMDVYLKAFQDYLTAENTYMNNLTQLLLVRATIFSRQ